MALGRSGGLARRQHSLSSGSQSILDVMFEKAAASQHRNGFRIATVALVVVLGLLATRQATAEAVEEAAPAAAPADDTRILHLLPIIDQRPTVERVESVIQSLGRGGPYLRVGFSGVFRYMADVDPQRDYQLVTTRLEEIAAVARQTQSPFLVHLNGGRWAGGGPLVQELARDTSTMAWDQHNHPWTYLVDGEYFYSLSTYNERYRFYKHRNLKVAAAWLAEFAAGPDGHLLVGVSTDSEVLLNLHAYYDYNPLVADEFIDWLAGRGPYGSGGRWRAEGQGLTLGQLNERYQKKYGRWEDVGPPRDNDGGAFWRAWQAFRVLLVDHHVQEQVDWIRQAGLHTKLVFSHQTPAYNPEVLGDSLDTAQVSNGALGLSLYDRHAVDEPLLERVKELSQLWGVFEYNPHGHDVSQNLAALDLLRAYAPIVVCPYHWDDLGGPNERGNTIAGTHFEDALRLFVGLYAEQPLPR
jgi:hypothetical protein